MAPQSTFGPESDAAKRGRAGFQAAGCSRCHGSDAEGGTGPEILRSALIRGDSCGTELKKLVATGRPDRGMPATVLDDARLNDIADYLHRRVDEIDFLSPSSRADLERALLTGDANAGKAYFNGAGGCSGCHSPSGDFKGIAARYDPLTLELRFVAPVQETASGRKFRGQLLGADGSSVSIQGDDGQKHTWQREAVKADVPPGAIVTLASGATVAGRILSIDEFEVSLEDEKGLSHTWRWDAVKVEVSDPLAAHAERRSKYSNTDIHNLLAFLETLK